MPQTSQQTQSFSSLGTSDARRQRRASRESNLQTSGHSREDRTFPKLHEIEHDLMNNFCESIEDSYEESYPGETLDEIEREELEFLAEFISGTAFYAERLEEYLGESLEDFWEAREHAYHIVTTYLLLNLSATR